MKQREKNECMGRNSRKVVSVIVVLAFSSVKKNYFEARIMMQRLFRKILSMQNCKKVELLTFFLEINFLAELFIKLFQVYVLF